MNERLADRLRKALEDEIVTGRLAPGTRLDEASLAKRFAVSRTPIREALSQLSASGIIDVRPRRGAIVTPVTAKTLVEMFEMMAEMEGVCGRLAARRMTSEERKKLIASHEACREAAEGAELEAYYELNVRFHRVIYLGAHNRCLAEEVRRLRRRLQPFRRLQLRVPGRIANSFAEHQGIVNAIVAGNQADAEERLRAHVMIQGERFSDLLMSLSTGGALEKGDAITAEPV